MIPALRQRFNAAFTDARYKVLLQEVNRSVYWPADFRVAESPLFLDADTTAALRAAADDLLGQLASPAFRAHAAGAIPAGLVVPGESPWPHFLCLDFALCHDAAGRVQPQLIELQGFPTVAAWQALLTSCYRRHFPEIPGDFTPYFGGLDQDGFLEYYRRVILGDRLPEHTVLLEIAPERQKTRVDFACTHAFLGIKPLCVTKVLKRGRQLFYGSGGREVRIERIFNRVIFDELLGKRPPMRFSFFEELDVEWAGHPNWYYRLSKHTLPFLRGPFVPPCLLASTALASPPADLDDHVLKPLYSFAGAGVDLAPTPEKLRALANPAEWLLQHRVAYAPVLATPDGPAKAEVRLILAGDGTRPPNLVTQLVRLTKGAMHGVAFNQGKTWVGSSAGFFAAG